MKRRIFRISAGVLLILTALSVPAVALAVSYYIPIVIDNDSAGSDYDCLPIIETIDNSKLAELGYIDDSGNDTRVIYGDTEFEHMVVSDRLAFVAHDVNKGVTYNYRYTMGNEPTGYFAIIPGYGGYITVPDHSSLEFADCFRIEQKGWVDTAAGSDKNLINKASAFKLYISAEGSITATINPGGTEKSVTATEISSGEHTVKVTSNGTTMRIYIDGGLEDSVSLEGVSVTDNTNDWVLIENNVMPYMEYLKILTGEE